MAHLRGRVVSGQANFGQWIARLSSLYEQNTGVRVYPGTLNQSFVAYVFAGVVGQSVGDWAVCRVCHELIEAGGRRGPLERSLDTLLEKNPDMRPAEAALRGQIAQFHRLLYHHQAGGMRSGQCRAWFLRIHSSTTGL